MLTYYNILGAHMDIVMCCGHGSLSELLIGTGLVSVHNFL